MGDVDLGLSAMLVALVAPVYIGPLDGDAGQALDLLDLPGQGMAGDCQEFRMWAGGVAQARGVGGVCFTALGLMGFSG